MKIFSDIAGELRGMFLGDIAFSIAILCLVGFVALIAGTSQLAGAILFLGCLLVLVWACLVASWSPRGIRRTKP